MSLLRTLADKFKAAPSVSNTTGMSMLLTDSNGNLGKIVPELEFFKFRCRCLFGTDKIHIIRREAYNNYTIQQWKTYTNQTTGWSLTMSNSSVGDIAVVIATSQEGKAVTFYARCTDLGSVNNRMCSGLMLELEGYQPLWATGITPL